MKNESQDIKCILANCEHYINWHKATNKYGQGAQGRICGYYAYSSMLNCSRWETIDPFRLLIAQRREKRKNAKTS